MRKPTAAQQKAANRLNLTFNKVEAGGNMIGHARVKGETLLYRILPDGTVKGL